MLKSTRSFLLMIQKSYTPGVKTCLHGVSRQENCSNSQISNRLLPGRLQLQQLRKHPRTAVISRRRGLKRTSCNILKYCVKEKKDKADAYTKVTEKKELRSIAIEDKILQGLKVSPDGRFVSYLLKKPITANKPTI